MIRHLPFTYPPGHLGNQMWHEEGLLTTEYLKTDYWVHMDTWTFKNRLLQRGENIEGFL